MNQTDVENALYAWLSENIGVRKVFTITFDGDFVTGNLIEASFDADVMEQVAFDTDQETTMMALARAIQDTEAIMKAVVTSARVITCTCALPGVDVTVTGPTVTLGASQPDATISVTTEEVAVPVWIGDQAEPPGDYPYATIRIDSVISLGLDEMRGVDDDTNMTHLGGQRQATVSVNYLGEKPMERLALARSSLEKISVLETFAESEIAIGSKNQVQNLTAMLESDFEKRSFFDFIIFYNENYEDDLSSIESVEIEDGRLLQPASFGTTYYTVGLSGNGQYIQTPIVVDPAATDFTIMVNAYLSAMAINPITGVANADTAIYAQANGTGTGRTWLGVQASSTSRGDFTSNFNGTVRVSDFTVRLRRWVTYAARYTLSTQTLDLFANGVLETTFTGVTPEAANGAHRIGIGKDGLNDFTGYIGPSAFYERALNDAQILAFADSLTAPLSESQNDFFYAMTEKW